MDLLLDVNIVVDICAPREEYEQAARDAVALCLLNKGRVWIYAGSVQTLEYTLIRELERRDADSGIKGSNQRRSRRARELLQEFCQDKNWLSALAGEGDVFSAADPEDEQLLWALDRFPPGSCKLLTRDKLFLNNYPEKAISPVGFCQLSSESKQIPFVDLSAQQDAIRPALERNIHTVLHHGKYILGPEVSQLEGRLSEYTGCEHVVSCSSGTDALLMSLMALGVGRGDAVFTTPFSFIATADVIARLGATPVFVDIDPSSYNLDPHKLEQAIQAVQANDSDLHPLPTDSLTNRHTDTLTPKAVIPVDLYGLPCDYECIYSVASSYNEERGTRNEKRITIIQDGAQSFGAEYQGGLCPTQGDIGCASFFPSKPLGSYGDAGALFTQDKDLADKLRSIRVHGQGASKYDTVRLGLKGRMDTLQAAILLPKLDVYPRELELRRKTAERYNELLSHSASTLDSSIRNPSIPQSLNSSIQLPNVPEDRKSAWALYTVLAQNEAARDKLQTALKKEGIPSVVYYAKPLHLQPVFAPLGYKEGDFPAAEDCASRCFSLPMHPYLRREEKEKVVSVIRENV